MLAHVQSFAPTTRIRSSCFCSHLTTAAARTQNKPWQTATSFRSTNGNDGSEEAQRLKEKAKKYRVEVKRLRLTLGLQKVHELEKDISDFMKGGDEDQALESSKLNEFKSRIEELTKESLGKEEALSMLAELSLFSSKLSPANAHDDKSDGSKASRLTETEMKRAVSYLKTLPTPVKDALAKLVEYPDYDSVVNLEEFVLKLYLIDDVSIENLRRLYYQSFSKHLPSVNVDEAPTKDSKDEDIFDFSKIFASQIEGIEDRIENNTRAMDLFPRYVQDSDEDFLPSEADAQVIFELLDRSFMATERPLKVAGGYIIRGTATPASRHVSQHCLLSCVLCLNLCCIVISLSGANKLKSASELLDFIDGRIAQTSPEWTERYQVNFVEVYSDASNELFEDALLLTPNQFNPLAPQLLVVATTAVALFSSFVFCIDTFAENPNAMAGLRGAVEMGQNGGVYDISWFNALLLPLVATLGTAQGFHEVAHLLVASWKKVKLTPPTVLPAQALPYLSFQNRIKTSPKRWSDLFDIAFVGPLSGLFISFLALIVGLQLTSQVDPDTAKLLPSLSVGYLAQSALAGTIVDLVLGGGDGILLNQDVTTQVPLHPVAIGGFIGLIIHALDLVPLGSTDGGRMSQAVLGRIWHLTFSSLVFLSLFIASFTSASDSGILLGFLLIYSFTQRDSEIPCRNEIDKVELPRAVAALVAWLLAALILVPLR